MLRQVAGRCRLLPRLDRGRHPDRVLMLGELRLHAETGGYRRVRPGRVIAV